MNRINRIVRTARDLETAGLAIPSYYLQLYAIELILEDKSKLEDLRQLASSLLDRVEKFKNEVQSMDDSLEEKRVLSTLLDDQGKAMVYCTNFAMTMYNNNLDKMNTSTDMNLDPTEDTNRGGSSSNERMENTADLKKALWCCIDLFSCIIKLWSDLLPDQQALQKRIKYCKLCLRKIATVEDNSLKVLSLPTDESTSKPTETENEVNTGDINTERKLDEEDGENETVDREISNMLEKLEKISSEDEREDTDIRMDDHEPDFIESEDETWREDEQEEEEEEEEEKNDNGLKPEVETKSSIHTDYTEHKETKLPSKQTPSGPVVHEKYTSSELENMMDRAEKIEKAQKMAKYAISALNYEDISTAKQELKDALNLLESLRE